MVVMAAAGDVPADQMRIDYVGLLREIARASTSTTKATAKKEQNPTAGRIFLFSGLDPNCCWRSMKKKKKKKKKRKEIYLCFIFSLV